MKIKQLFLGTLTIFGMALGANAQMKVGNNPSTINANSILEMEATNRGMLLPRVLLSASDNFAPLTAHIAGMVVYNTATAGSGVTAVSPGYYYNNGTGWLKLAPEGSVILSLISLTSSSAPAGTATGQMAYNTNAASGLPVGPVYWSGSSWVPVTNGITTASNGLTAVGGEVKLGGTLTAATIIDKGTNPLTLSGAGNTLITDGNVGIGTNSPTAKLEVAGQVKITGGVPGAGKVLTSDATGLATWETINAGTVTNVTGTAPINVATGTITPVISLNDAGVTNAKLGDDAVTTAKILDGTIVNNDIEAGVGGIYKGSGTLPGATTVTQGANNLEFVGAGNLIKTGTGNVGIGTTTPTSKFQVSGSIATAMNNSSASITLNETHNTLTIDLTSGDATVTLPAANTCVGRVYHIVRTDGTSNVLTFSAAVSLGSTTFTTSNIPGATFIIQSDGTNWRLINN